MKRDLEPFKNTEFDLIVVGGGINGAGIAWDAALRGLKVGLVEKSDFGGATSAGCFKIIHGGMRYLQHFDLPRLYESVREQQILRQIAPHLIMPFPFLVPCYDYGMKGREVMQLGMMLYELLTCSRNKGVRDSHKLPSHQVLSKEDVLRIAPYIEQRGLRAGVVYYDCQMNNCERFTFSVVASAEAAGAVVANYFEVLDLNLETFERGKKINSLIAQDQISKERFVVKTKSVVSASGPWTENFTAKMLNRQADKRPAKKVFSKGIQLVLPKLVDRYAVAVESRFQDAAARISRGGRSFFLQPWREHTLLGTSDSTVEVDPDNFLISEKEISKFLEDVKKAYPDPKLELKNVKHAFGGLRVVDARALANASEGDATVSRDATVVDYAEEGIANFISVVGVKYTTFRALAEKVVDEMQKKITGETSPSKTKTTMIYDAKIDEGNKEEFYQHVIREEMVCKLDDFIMRRTGIGTLGYPEGEELARISQLVARG